MGHRIDVVPRLLHPRSLGDLGDLGGFNSRGVNCAVAMAPVPVGLLGPPQPDPIVISAVVF